MRQCTAHSLVGRLTHTDLTLSHAFYPQVLTKLIEYYLLEAKSSMTFLVGTR